MHKRSYLTKLSVQQCKKILADKTWFDSQYGMLEVIHKKEKIFFRIRFYRGWIKTLIQLDGNTETKISIIYQLPLLLRLGMVSWVFIMLVCVSMIFSNNKDMTAAGIYGTSLFATFICLGWAGALAIRKISFRVTEDFIKSKLGGL